MPRCGRAKRSCASRSSCCTLSSKRCRFGCSGRIATSNYLGSNHLFALDAGLTDSEQLVGKSDFDFPWHSQAPAYRADDLAVMESGLPRLQIEEQMTRADGSTIWVQTNKSPLRDSSGAIIGLIGAMLKSLNSSGRKQRWSVLWKSRESWLTSNPASSRWRRTIFARR